MPYGLAEDQSGDGLAHGGGIDDGLHGKNTQAIRKLVRKKSNYD